MYKSFVTDGKYVLEIENFSVTDGKSIFLPIHFYKSVTDGKSIFLPIHIYKSVTDGKSVSATD